MSTVSLEPSFQQRPRSMEGGTGAALLFIWVGMVLFLWGFAFLPTPDTSPEWVIQTQAACFGTLSSGLPAPHGWMLLVLSPLALLSIMWASHAKEMAEAPSYVRHSKPAKYILVGLIATSMWVAHWVGKRVTYAYRISRLSLQVDVKDPLPEDYLRLNKLVPEFHLIDQEGKVINQEVFRGHVTILTFAFAHCANVCPMLIKDLKSANSRINSKDLQTIVMAIDPWRDTPSTLPALAKKWDLAPGSHILSGEPEEVLKTLNGMQVTTSRNVKTGEVSHAAQIMIVDRSGKIAYSFLNPSVDWIVTAAGRLLYE